MVSSRASARNDFVWQVKPSYVSAVSVFYSRRAWLPRLAYAISLIDLTPARGNPIINADFSRSRADQPDQDNDIQSFWQIEEIVEPIESRDAFRNRRQLDRRDRDAHLDDESHTTQAREHSDDEQTSADEFNRGNEIGHEMRKRYPCAGQGFIHLASPARYEELIAARNGEKYSERYAGEQNRKLFPRRVCEQHRSDQWRDFHGVSFSVSNRI